MDFRTYKRALKRHVLFKMLERAEYSVFRLSVAIVKIVGAGWLASQYGGRPNLWALQAFEALRYYQGNNFSQENQDVITKADVTAIVILPVPEYYDLRCFYQTKVCSWNDIRDLPKWNKLI